MGPFFLAATSRYENIRLFFPKTPGHVEPSRRSGEIMYGTDSRSDHVDEPSEDTVGLDDIKLHPDHALLNSGPINNNQWVPAWMTPTLCKDKFLTWSALKILLILCFTLITLVVFVMVPEPDPESNLINSFSSDFPLISFQQSTFSSFILLLISLTLERT